jgi:hypothetical protein
MISFEKYSSKTKIPDADYVFDKTDKLYDLLSLLTPKFKGNWLIILIDPKLKFVKDLIQNHNIPTWVNILIYLNSKKLEEVVVQHPDLQPKEKSKKETFNDMIGKLNHLIDKRAKATLFAALSVNMSDLEETLTKLDSECTGDTITYKQVQNVINYTKRVYASDVINAFLLGDARRWSLYNSIVQELGMEYSYYAMYKYVKGLLSAKGDYLQNKDVKQFVVKKIEAPRICYAYVLFANSTNYYQLYCILYSLEHRSDKSLHRFVN